MKRILALTALLTACRPIDNQQPLNHAGQQTPPQQELQGMLFKVTPAYQAGPTLDSAAIAALSAKYDVESPIGMALEKTRAELYVLDVSGSMNDAYGPQGHRRIDDVIAYRFPAGAHVFACATQRSDTNGTPQNALTAAGGTPFYTCLENRVEHADSGARVGGLTDGRDDNLDWGQVNRIAEKAQAKRITLYFVTVGLDQPVATQQLDSLARATGGTVQPIR